MRRREFITLASSTAIAWPLAARAQKKAMPLIGFLGLRTPEFDAALLSEFRRGMSEGGFVEGTNVAIEFRWAAGHFDRLPALAEDLVRQRVDLLVTTGGTAAARAAKAVAASTPIVFVIGDDPVQYGLVPALIDQAEISPASRIFSAR